MAAIVRTRTSASCDGIFPFPKAIPSAEFGEVLQAGGKNIKSD